MNRWRLRDDLVLSRQEGAEGPIYVVKDPATGRFFRFGEVEHFILRQLGDTPDLNRLRERAEARFGASVTLGSVERFLDNARRLGLLQEGEAAPARADGRRGRIRGTPLYLRVKVCDPDRLLAALASRLGFAFTPTFLVATACVILVAIVVFIENRAEFLQDLLRQLEPRTFVVAWLMVFAVTILHESAHGITCRRFGGEVHEVGVMLIYLQPAFYCNVSDAWLFPEKSRRLWVTFSGAYFEVFLWALATLGWRATESDTPVHFAALVVMATSGIKSLFNLNPLIKLDDYYLLSDYLELPNLRSRAFGYVRGVFRQFLGASSTETSLPTPRERRLYAAYGVVAGAFSVAMLGLVLIHIGGRLVQRYQAAGFLLFTGVITMIFQNPIRRLFGRSPEPPASRTDVPAPGRRRLKLCLLAFGVAAVAFFVRLDLKVSGNFKILPSQNADITASVDGVIEEVPVDEGQEVKTGDLVVRLSDRDLRAELRRVSAEMEEKEATLRMLSAKTVGSRSVVEKNQERLRFGGSAYRRIRNLAGEGLASARDIDEAKEQVAVRTKELDQARSDLKAANSEIEADEASIASLQAQRDYLEDQIGRLNLVSPHPGVVTTPRLKEKVGQYVRKGDLVATVHELTKVMAEIEVPEKEIADVRLGQQVFLKVRALPGRTFSGVVTAIAPAVATADEESWIKVVRVTTTLENADRALRSDMTGTAKIVCGSGRIVDLLTRWLASTLRIELWSWW